MPDAVPPSTPPPDRRRLLPVLAAAAVVAGVGLGAAALAGRPGSGDDADGAPAAGATASAGATPLTTPPPTTPSTTDAPSTPDPTGAAPAVVPDPGAPSIAFLGDSLTVGVGAPPERGYAWQTAERLGWPIALVEGVSGSGFLAPGGGEPMPDRVDDVVAARPDVVVVAGGTNDVFWGFPPDDVERAAAGLLRDLRAGLPDARVVVLGPLPTSFGAVDDPNPTREAVRAAAQEAGVEYVDAGAVVGAAVTDAATWDSYISDDGLHPNERGYAVLAEALAVEIDALVE